MRIAILGGSFDPIHNGHLQLAKTAKKKLQIAEVWLMPSVDTPLKARRITAFYQRCAMITAAIRPYRYMKLCTLEKERSGISYTIDTVRELKKRYPQHTFCWLIGDDQAKQFTKWKEHEALLREIDFYVFSREAEVILPKGLRRVVMPLVPISSTRIRQGSSLWQVPAAVRRIMTAQDLYLLEMVASRMSEKRYRHSVSVAKLCVELAKAHHLDVHAAWQMGMTHDMCKELPYEQALIWMRHHLPQYMEEAAAIWHGYIGAYEVKHTLGIDDRRVADAIFHHVKGDGTSPYAKILFIADKLDPSRGYDSHAQIALSLRDLEAGYQRVKQEQRQYLRKEGVL